MDSCANWAEMRCGALIYTRVARDWREQPATADVFPVVANKRTKSIQKQVKRIDVDKVGSKKHLAGKSSFA